MPTLGQQGLTVVTPRTRLTITAGVVGEKVSVLPRGRGSDWATLKKVLDRSPARTVAPCAVLHQCGACTLQQMDYQEQLAAKTEALRTALEKMAKRIDPVKGLPQPFGSRTKLLMPAADGVEGLRFGFYRRNTLKVVPAAGCPVQHPLTLSTLAWACQVLDGQKVKATQKGGKGWLHALGVRSDPATQKSELLLSARTEQVPGGKETIAQLAALPNVHAVHLAVQPKRTSFPFEPPIKTVAGPPRMPLTLAGERFVLAPETFTQTSAQGAALLGEMVLSLLPEKISSLADLYGGAGFFSRISQARWNRALVVDDSRSAITDLKRQLKREPIAGLSAQCGRVEQLASAIARRKPDLVLLDPPRSGCKPKVIDSLLQIRARTIIYVSCGFEAFLRDVSQLVKGGYRVDRVKAVDLFPHTTHLEVVARLSV